jgi:2-methylcitrate dehydratase PrpD
MKETYNPDVTKVLARYASDLQFADLPDAAVDRLKACLLDTIGCGLFGSTLQWGNIIADFAIEMGGAAESSLWGFPQKVAAQNAALANGTMVHGFEIDDLHKDSIVHLGSVAIPPVLALAERIGAVDGRRFVTAIAAGYEVGARIGMGVGVPHFHRGFHPTGTVGAFAAGVATGKLLELDHDGMIHTMGISGTQGAGLMAAQFSAMVKRMHAGKAAQSGLLGGLLAKRGFTGIMDIVEAKFGGFSSSMSESYNLDKMTNDLGDKLEILNVGFKPYASVGVSHTPLDAIKAIKEENDLTPDSIKKVTVWANKMTIVHAGWEYVPDAITTAQLNLYYVLAAMIEEGNAFVNQFTGAKIKDPAILRHIPKIEIIHEPSFDDLPQGLRHRVNVKITTTDNRTFEKIVDHAKGSHKNPMTMEEVVGKFRLLASKVFDKERVAEIESAVFDVENEDNVSRLGDLLRTS